MVLNASLVGYLQDSTAILLKNLAVYLCLEFFKHLSMLNHATMLIVGYYPIHAPMYVLVKLFPFMFQFWFFQATKSFLILIVSES